MDIIFTTFENSNCYEFLKKWSNMKNIQEIKKADLPVPCYAAIHYQGEPVLVNFQDGIDKMYWWHGGFSYMSTPDILEVYKTWPYTEDDEKIENIDRIYVKEIWNKLPVEKPELTTGWLSPEGKFWLCPYTGHDFLAWKLCILEYNKFEHSPVYFLEKENWARINKEYLYSENGLTIEQIKYFKKALKNTQKVKYPVLHDLVIEYLECAGVKI